MTPGGRVCRVAPDVTAVERTFDYEVPAALAARVRVGSIVRVPLHGRRVRGWVVADDVEPEVRDALLPLAAVVSEGPPPAVVELARWVAWRWCGPLVAVLRSASPPNVVPPGGPGPGAGAPGAPSTAAAGARRVAVVRVPPLRDRRPVVESLLASAGSTIVCVADHARASVLARSLAATGRPVAFAHSGETDGQRTRAWRRATAGGCVVVGGRVAALAPVPDLAAVVVVDDADEALQEERVPTWHARDVLAERARRAGAAFTVVSAAPTVEALAMPGVQVHAPAADVEATGWPRTLVVDRRQEPPGARLLTEPLTRALRGAQGFAVCVLNRRGRFRLLACAECHGLVRWDRADERPALCGACGSTRLRVLRSGVTRVREELAALVPGSDVVDVDAETGPLPEGAHVAVGTEAVLHRADVRRRRPVLVAYLDLDQELFAPRYRAAVQALWLVARGAQLLAARPRRDTLLLLQTRAPDHEVVRAVAHGDPAAVAAAELERRRVLGYPPFGAVAELTGDDAALAAAAGALRAAGVRVLGPGDGRALALAAGADALAGALAAAVRAARPAGRLRVAVDPPRV